MWGTNSKNKRIDGKKCLYFKDEIFPFILSHIEIEGDGRYDTTDATKYTFIPTLYGDFLLDYDRNYIPRCLLSCIKKISCGYYHTCMILNKDESYVWGLNKYGQLGLGDTHARVDIGQIQNINVSNIHSISCGGYHTIALMTDGRIWVWGWNGHGQLGLGDNHNRMIPTELFLPNILMISCGMCHTIALAPDKFFVWGDNYAGQLGLGDFNPRNTPQEFISSNIISICCGAYHSMALTSSGEVYSWGSNQEGQLGLGHYRNEYIPTKVSLLNVISLSCGRDHSVALTLYDEIYVWGSNKYGQLGLEDDVSHNKPYRI